MSATHGILDAFWRVNTTDHTRMRAALRSVVYALRAVILTPPNADSKRCGRADTGTSTINKKNLNHQLNAQAQRRVRLMKTKQRSAHTTTAATYHAEYVVAPALCCALLPIRRARV